MRLSRDSIGMLKLGGHETEWDAKRRKCSFDARLLPRSSPQFRPNRFVYILPDRVLEDSELRLMSHRDFLLKTLGEQAIPLLETGRRNLRKFIATAAPAAGQPCALKPGRPPVTFRDGMVRT